MPNHIDKADIPTQPRCLNCGNPITESDKYCPVCGQKNNDGRISFRQFLADFFEAAFNLDSRLLKTMPALMVPGKLTRVYFSGKHNAYFKPLRLFFTTMIVFYAVIGFKYLNNLESLIEEQNPMETFTNTQFAVDYFDTIVAGIGYDTLTEDQKSVVDTIRAGIHAPFDELLLDDASPVDSDVIFGLHDSVNFTGEDFYTLSADSILEKYQIKGFFKRLSVRQSIVMTKHPGKVVRFVIGNTTWMIILMLPVVAGFMQLIYIRRKTYFIEHLIFLYHYHAATFLVMTIYALLYPILASPLTWVIPVCMSVFFLASMKMYYDQNWFKTLLKFGLLGIAYFFLLMIFGGITSVVSFFLYQ